VEAKAGELQVQGQPGQFGETLSQTKVKKVMGLYVSGRVLS
jgi:hypothetical protein